MYAKHLILSALVVVWLGYLLYERFPGEVADETNERLDRFMFMGMGLYVKTKALLGFGTEVSIFRGLVGSALPTFERKDDPQLKVYDTKFDGVPVRVYRPVSSKLLPGLVFYHGGAWIIGNIETHDGLTRRIAKDGNLVVVSVEYGLAPEHKHPESLEDCLKATKEFIRNAHQFGVDASRVGVGGDSAGGHLAAAVSMKIRDESVSPLIKVQIQLYPKLQHCNTNLPIHYALSGMYELSMWFPNYVAEFLFTDDDEIKAFNSGKYITPELQEECKHFVNEKLIPKDYIPTGYKPGTDDMVATTSGAKKVSKKLKDPSAFPLMATDFRGMPAAYVLTCGIDGLRDDGIIYAKRLEKDGVKVQWYNYANATHGFMTRLETSPVFVNGYRTMMNFIENNL